MSDSIQTSGPRELARWAYDMGFQNRDLRTSAVGLPNNSSVLALVPEGHTIQSLDPFLPKLPHRRVNSVNLNHLGSFCDYINAFKTEHSRIFAKITAPPYSFSCVLDYHEAGPVGLPAWCEHTVTLELMKDPEFGVWLDNNGRWMKQETFAEWLKDNRVSISEPSGATVLELVMALEATQSSHCRSTVRTNAGMILAYEESTKTNIPMPDKLRLFVPFFLGFDPVDIEADFKFRVNGGEVAFAYRMLSIAAMLRAAVLACATQIRERTQLPVHI